MAQRLNDARYQTTSKESSPLKVKRRRFFSFRGFILNKQRKSDSTQIAGNGGDSCLYHTIPRAVRDSDDDLQTRSATKSRVFATLFRRSTPTRRSAKRPSIRLLTQTHPLSSVLDPSANCASPTENSDEVPVILNNSAEPQFHQCGYSDTAPLSVVRPGDAVVEADARLPEEDRQDTTGPTLLFSVSHEETLCLKPLLPTPLIIVSAPTPPQLYLLVQTDDEPENSKSLELPLDHPAGILQQSILETFQHVARQLAEDPAWTQAHVYRLAIPVVVFLYTLAMGVILPRKKDDVFDRMVANERDPVFYAFLLALLGLLVVLAFLKLIIYIMSRLVHSFCALDLEVLKKGVCIDSEGNQFGEADLIIGNLLG
jgi:hypothetical protein